MTECSLYKIGWTLFFKKSLIKSFQKFLFKNHIEEFEGRLVEHFFKRFIILIILLKFSIINFSIFYKILTDLHVQLCSLYSEK